MPRDVAFAGRALASEVGRRPARASCWVRLALAVALVAGLVLAVVPVRQVSAATLVVTNPADSGPNTLRDRVSTAVAGDTITFSPSLKGQTITLTTGEIRLTRNVTIQGPGAGLLAVSGNNNSRVFAVNSGVTATITGLTLKNGNSPAANGGALFNGGTLIVGASTITASAGSNGGGIFNGTGGTLVVYTSTISNNTVASGNSGGGLYNNNGGTLTVLSSTISGNSASYGAGIFNDGAAATVANSTISGNSASTRGGAISNSNAGAVLTVRNVTISGNGAPTGGGQLHTRTSAVTNLVNTILANSAQGPNCGVSESGV